MELISCITPTFNRKLLLENAIKSCLAQTYKNWEMIIVDDGSNDGTEALVQQYLANDHRIKFFKNPGKGPNSARNFGIKHSLGNFIVFLDDDDENLPHRFESQLSAIKRSGHNFILSWFQFKDLKTGKITGLHRHKFLGQGAGQGIRWMISKDLLQKAGLFDEDMPSMQEVELSYRIAQLEKYAFHDSVVVSGGINHTSITKNPLKMIEGKIRLMEKHHHNMHLLEAASWYYIIGMDYYFIGDYKKAVDFMSKAALNDARGIYKIAYFYSIIFLRFKGIFRKVNNRVLRFILNFKFPTLVEHPIIN